MSISLVSKSGVRLMVGITEVEYEIEREQGILRGRGDEGYDILFGNKSVKGKLKIWQTELEQIIAQAPNGDPTKVKFDIIWTFLPNTDGALLITDTIKTACFSGYKKSAKQGDLNMEIELPFIALKVVTQS